MQTEIVERVARLDIQDIKKAGILEKEPSGESTRLEWPGVGTIRVKLDPFYEGEGQALWIHYSSPTEESISHWVDLASVPCSLGGKRWLFKCPHFIDGEMCERRCRYLHLRRDYKLACRRCAGLDYERSQKRRNVLYEGLERPLRILEQVTAKLERVRGKRSLDRLVAKRQAALATIHRFQKELAADLLRVTKIAQVGDLSRQTRALLRTQKHIEKMLDALHNSPVGAELIEHWQELLQRAKT